jgi:hypothetical protein
LKAQEWDGRELEDSEGRWKVDGLMEAEERAAGEKMLEEKRKKRAAGKQGGFYGCAR